MYICMSSSFSNFKFELHSSFVSSFNKDLKDFTVIVKYLIFWNVHNYYQEG
jgi:hypothetical protein